MNWIAFTWWKPFKRFFWSLCVEKSRRLSFGWLDDNSAVCVTMKINAKLEFSVFKFLSNLPSWTGFFESALNMGSTRKIVFTSYAYSSHSNTQNPCFPTHQKLEKENSCSPTISRCCPGTCEWLYKIVNLRLILKNVDTLKTFIYYNYEFWLH